MKNESHYTKFLIVGVFLCLAGPVWAHIEEQMANRRFEKIILNMQPPENSRWSYQDLDKGAVMLGKFNGNRKGLWCSSIGAAIAAWSLFGLFTMQKGRVDKIEKFLVSGVQHSGPQRSPVAEPGGMGLGPWQDMISDELTDYEKQILFQMETSGPHDGLFQAVSFGLPCVLIIGISLKYDFRIGVVSGIVTYAGIRLWFVHLQDAMTPHLSSAIRKIRTQNKQAVTPNPPASDPAD